MTQLSIRGSGLFVLMYGIPLFARYHFEIKEVIGFIPYDVNINQTQI